MLIDFFPWNQFNGFFVGTFCETNFTIFFVCTLCVIFMILVSLENVKKMLWVVARLPQRLKSKLFEIFSTLRAPFGHPPFENFSNNIDFSLWDKQCIVQWKWDQNCKNHTFRPFTCFFHVFMRLMRKWDILMKTSEFHMISFKTI